MSPTGILTCCMIHSEVVPFLFLASVCRSLQCLISALTQVGGGGLLFRFACSAVLRGGRGAADKCHWHLQGTLAVFQPHWARPRSGVCALPVYTAQAPGCSIRSGPCGACGPSFRVFHRSADSVGPASSAFPHRSSSGSQEHDGRTIPGCSVPYPLCGPSLSFRAPVGCVRLVSVLGGRPLAKTLPADVDHSKPQKVFG